MHHQYLAMRDAYLRDELDLLYFREVLVMELSLLPLESGLSYDVIEDLIQELRLLKTKKEFLLWEESLLSVILH